MTKLTRCKNCTGELVFSPDKNALSCERCGSQFNIKERANSNIKRMYDPSYVPQEKLDNQVTYKCSSCSSRIIAGTDCEIHRCSSCGNTTLKKEISVLNTPDGIIPFKITRNKAGEIFRKWVANRKFAPSDLVQMAKLEKISGFYTPIWNFNYTSIYKYSLVGVKKSLDSYDNEVRREYPINKIIEDRVENEIHSASTRISDSSIVAIGRYDFAQLRPFSTDYLLGFTGLDTNKDIHKLYNNICANANIEREEKIKNQLEESYDYLEDFKSITKLNNVSYNHAYVPVWANHYSYKGKEYHCYINGQTGETVGSSPKSIWKIAGTVLGILGGIGLAVLIISSFL